MTRVAAREGEEPIHPPEPLERLDVLWRVIGASGVIWECVWYRRGSRFEFRVQREDDERDVIALRSFARISDEMAVCAREWLSVATAKGFIPVEDNAR
jgi:hypothetical protein